MKTAQPVCAAPLEAPHPANTCAIIVTYFPDAGFEQRLCIIEQQFSQVILIDNASQAESARRLDGLVSGAGRHAIRNRQNLGIACALNQGLAFADARGCQWAVTFDQDSEIGGDLLETLANVYRAMPGANHLFGVNYWNPHYGRFLVPTQPGRIGVARATIITSGMLIPLALVREIGGFREDYFIDAVDHEFCLRVRAQGGKVILACKPAMIHGFGETAGRRYFRWAGINHHGPARKYFIARNSLVTALAYWRREPLWSLRQCARLLIDFGGIVLLEAHKRAKLSAFMRGITHALAGKMGPIAGHDGKEIR